MRVLVSDDLSDLGVGIFQEAPEIEVDVNTELRAPFFGETGISRLQCLLELGRTAHGV